MNLSFRQSGGYAGLVRGCALEQAELPAPLLANEETPGRGAEGGLARSSPSPGRHFVQGRDRVAARDAHVRVRRSDGSRACCWVGRIPAEAVRAGRARLALNSNLRPVGERDSSSPVPIASASSCPHRPRGEVGIRRSPPTVELHSASSANCPDLAPPSSSQRSSRRRSWRAHRATNREQDPQVAIPASYCPRRSRNA